MAFYDEEEGEFIDFETLEDWERRDKAKDATIARLEAEGAALRERVVNLEYAMLMSCDPFAAPDDVSAVVLGTAERSDEVQEAYAALNRGEAT